MKGFNLRNIALTVCLGATSLQASAFQDNLTELASEADGVLKGTVIEQVTGMIGGTIYTWVTLGDLDVLNGQYAGREFTVKLCGGEYRNRHQLCFNTPSFELSDEVVFFIDNDSTSDLPFEGGLSGVFYVEDGSLSNEVNGGEIEAGELAMDEFKVLMQGGKVDKRFYSELIPDHVEHEKEKNAYANMDSVASNLK